jgi:hypothetical protein
MPFVWSQATLDLVYRLYMREGRSAAETARLIGAGATRNAVLGKTQRMGWIKPRPSEPKAPDPPPRRPREATRSVFRRPPFFRDIPLPPLREARVRSIPKPWTERERGECAFPVGEPDRPDLQLSCCAPSGAAAYCRAHRALMIEPGSRLTDKDQDAIAEIARRAA